ncbi:hypothetical protein DFH94DRAFT_239968 [Russula ochroleuca]|jgi:hypothetical protein|uniref:Uncharacterized protein n=1 Tax=Russula ochroleuca TaxID=152965 RepID=A0A9P5N276_9AGAM|nr:hypothetical protein DFH94DRAFT_239968 [Russula ochroleuca]
MPPRSPPKILQVLVKTHKSTVFLSLPNETSVAVVKEQVLSAFLDDVFKAIHDVPKIFGLDDFVLSREVMERGQDTTFYEVLTDDQVLKDVVGNWAVLFVQFKDDSGRIQPVEVTIPSLMDDEDELSGTPGVGNDLAMDIDETFEESSVRKGKRKALD